MAQFNLADYETVEERIRRFYADNPTGRILTENQTKESDRAKGIWIVKAEIWLPTWTLGDEAKNWVVVDQASGWFLKATGIAFEIDGQGMANKTSALENAETSAIGRALANAGYSGNKRATREEMAKVERGVTPVSPKRDWLTEADVAQAEGDVQALRLLYADAVAAKVDEQTLATIKNYGSSIAPDSAGKSGRTSRAN